MTLIKWSPMLPWSVFDDMDRVVDEFWSPQGRSMRSFVPAVDVYETKDDVVVEAALAGIDPEKVDVSIENDVLVLEAKDEKKTEVDEKNYYRKEVRVGAFHRVIALPTSVQAENADATYEKGVLRITIPKREDIKPKSVKVNVKK